HGFGKDLFGGVGHCPAQVEVLEGLTGLPLLFPFLGGRLVRGGSGGGARVRGVRAAGHLGLGFGDRVGQLLARQVLDEATGHTVRVDKVAVAAERDPGRRREVRGGRVTFFHRGRG